MTDKGGAIEEGGQGYFIIVAPFSTSVSHHISLSMLNDPDPLCNLLFALRSHPDKGPSCNSVIERAVPEIRHRLAKM